MNEIDQLNRVIAQRVKFTTKPSSNQATITGGYAAGPGADPCSWAEELFGDEIDGAWLCCYMLRRFGWPNSGSDDYKNLCTWTLTTPIRGLYLAVTPYLGGGHLHFAVRYNRDVGKKLSADPGRTAFFRRREKAVMNWWRKTGIKLYAWGYGLKEGDHDELVHHFCDCPKDSNRCFGLWKRSVSIKHKGNIPKGAQMIDWWLSELIKKRHPEVRLPKMNKRELANRTTRFQQQAKRAIKITMTDLLRPTHVRDISFTPFGDIERNKVAVKHYRGQTDTGFFVGSGYTPEYWYTKATRKERLGGGRHERNR
jgi:hypothetical protein